MAEMQKSIDSAKRFKSLIRSLRPTAKAHARYSDQALRFSKDHEMLRSDRSAKKIELKKISFMESDLFDCEFLVGRVGQTWFETTAPGCNAIATTSLQVSEISSPPIVLLPLGRRVFKRGSADHSIIEHEFVHICQAIRGIFPGNFENADSPLDLQFTDYVRAEFEANFLQLMLCPKLLPPAEYGINLEEWCFLRGYTQALERFLYAGVSGNFSQEQLFSALEHLPQALQTFIEKSKLDTPVSSRFIERLKIFTIQALSLAVPRGALNLRQAKVHDRVVRWAQK